jgi:hypothetical protein
MLPSKIYTLTLDANETRRLLVTGNAFKIISSTGSINAQSNFGTLENISTGQGLSDTDFSFLTLIDTSGALNVIRLFIGDQNFIDTSTQVVTNKQTQTANFANTAKTVTNASTQLVAANAARQYFLTQNKSATGTVYLNFGTAAATVANGIKIGPGGSYEMNQTQSTQAMQCIGDIASNNSVVVIEG